MLNLPGPALAHLASENRRLTVCGTITKSDGSVLRCTQFDEDIEITGGAHDGVYFSTAAVTASDVVSTSDMAVNNLEMHGVFADAPNSDAFGFTGFTVADVVGGLFRNSTFTLFICQWDNPSAWQKVIETGNIGAITRTAEGTFVAEWRGLTQKLQQNIGRVYAELCDVKDFCDSRCKLNIADFSFLCTVGVDVASRREFKVVITGTFPSDPTTFDLGKITFNSGANDGYVRQIKRQNNDNGELELWEELPFDLVTGDTGVIVQGCDRRFVTCQKFNNWVNFRGHGLWIPGLPKIIRAP